MEFQIIAQAETMMEIRHKIFQIKLVEVHYECVGFL